MRDVIARQAPSLMLPPAVDRERLLAAISMVESAGGRDKRMRFESAYYKDGFYFVRSPEMQERFNRWQQGTQKVMLDAVGRMTACSFGPWQVLYTVAAELGFDGAPWELADPRVCLFYAVKLINGRIAPHVADKDEETAVLMVARGYNAGSVMSKVIPEKYMARVLAHYADPNVMDKLITLQDY